MNGVTTVAQNFANRLEQFKRGYETNGKGIIHGFEKDCIQNSVGARFGKKMVEVKFSLVNNSKGQFLVVEDTGTFGLTGVNYSQTELKQIQNSEKIVLDCDSITNGYQRLGRFTSLNNSGDNDGGGLFGRGKFMYQAVSEENKYYFDSYNIDNKYYSNYMQEDQILENNKVDSDAKEYIFEQTGLLEKLDYGTRVIIVKPNKDIVSSILSGEFVNFIQDTWWFAIYQQQLKVVISDGKKEYTVSNEPFIDNLFNSPKSYCNSHEIELHRVNHYYIKKLRFAFSDKDLPEAYRGVYIYRKKMQICTLYKNTLSTIPEKYRNRLFGYIEFTKEYEDLIENNENVEHYGIGDKLAYLTKVRAVFKTELESYMDSVGIKKSKKANTNQVLSKLANRFQDYMHGRKEFGFENYSVKKKNVINDLLKIKLTPFYPHDNREYYDGDDMTYSYEIINQSNLSNFEISIINLNNKSKMYTNSVTIMKDESYMSQLINLDYSLLEFGKKNKIVINVNDGNNSISRSFYVFYACKDEKQLDDYEFKVVNVGWPNDNKSIYTGESLSNFEIRVENNSGYDSELGIIVETFNIENRKSKLFLEYNGTLHVNSGNVGRTVIDSINFSNRYYDEMSNGRIELRTRLVHLKSGNTLYSYAEKLKKSSLTVFFNQEEQKENLSLFNEVSTKPLEDKYIRSMIEKDNKNGYNFIINSSNPIYNKLQVDTESYDFQRFSLEEMIKRVIEISLENENYKFIDMESDGDSNLEVIKKAERKLLFIVDKYLEEVYPHE